MAAAQTMTLQPPPPTISTTILPPSSFLQYAKSCGRCTPSLLPNESEWNIDKSFYDSVSKLVDFSVQGVYRAVLCAFRVSCFDWHDTHSLGSSFSWIIFLMLSFFSFYRSCFEEYNGSWKRVWEYSEGRCFLCCLFDLRYLFGSLLAMRSVWTWVSWVKLEKSYVLDSEMMRGHSIPYERLLALKRSCQSCPTGNIATYHVPSNLKTNQQCVKSQWKMYYWRSISVELRSRRCPFHESCAWWNS